MGCTSVTALGLDKPKICSTARAALLSRIPGKASAAGNVAPRLYSFDGLFTRFSIALSWGCCAEFKVEGRR